MSFIAKSCMQISVGVGEDLRESIRSCFAMMHEQLRQQIRESMGGVLEAMRESIAAAIQRSAAIVITNDRPIISRMLDEMNQGDEAPWRWN